MATMRRKLPGNHRHDRRDGREKNSRFLSTIRAIEKMKLEGETAVEDDSVNKQAVRVARLSQRFHVKRTLSVKMSESFERRKETGESVEEFIPALRRLTHGCKLET